MFPSKILYGLLGIVVIIGAGCSITTSDKIDDSKKVQSDGNETPNENYIQPIIDIGEDVDADYMFKTVTYLAEQPRAAGTEGEMRAVDYIESQFKSLGFSTEIQEFPIVDFKKKHLEVIINEKPLSGEIQSFLGNHVSGKVTAELVNVGKARNGEVGEEVNGKIVLIESGELPIYEKIDHVLAKGAIGAIMYHDEKTYGSLYGRVPDKHDIPIVSVSREQGLNLVEQINKGSVKAQLDVVVERTNTSSYNVIATMKPNPNQDTGQIITVGAHHDSVPHGPGANDDASGVSAVLELARIFSKKSLDTEVRFITFGAEERGLVGSSHYVNTLLPEDMKKMVAHFQMDMVGAAAAGGQMPGGGLIMFTIDGRKNLVTDLGAAASKNVFSEAIPYGQLGRSDHQPFHDAGIPSALFIHAPLEPDYHQPTDTLDKISKEKLQQVAEIVGSAAYTIASPETPAIKDDTTVPASVEYEYENRHL